MSTDTMYLFSIVIVTYNNQNEIGRCLDSVLSHTENQSTQIVIVDNHSSDLTVGLIKEEYGDTKPPILLIDNPSNWGFTKALNQGLRRCEGRYILVLNPDTEITTGCLDELQAALERDGQAAVVAPQLLNPDGSVQASCRRFPRYRDVLFELSGLSYLFPGTRLFGGWKMGDFDHLVQRYVEQPQGACLFFKKERLDDVGLWDEQFPMFFSDVDWCHRVRDLGWKILFFPGAHVFHDKGKSVMRNRAQMIWTSHHSFYRYFRKYNKGLLNSILNTVIGGILLPAACIRIVVNRLQGLINKNEVLNQDSPC